MFVRSGTSWSQEAKLTADDAAPDDFFGWSVDISGDTVVVGSRESDHSAKSDAGAAYVFTRSGTTWSQQAKLTASDADEDDHFGEGVAIDIDTVIVGARDADIGAEADAGAAYVFLRTGTSWSEQAKLAADDAAAGDAFARTVDIDGDHVIMGAHAEDHDSKNVVGAAYVFFRSGTTWSQQVKLIASDEAAGDELGKDVGIDSFTAIAGASRHTHDLTTQGAAYIFDAEDPSGTTSTGDTGDLSAKIDAIEAKLDASLDATVSSRATQTSVDSLTSTIGSIDAAVAVIESKLDALDLGAISAAIGALGIDISIVEAKLDAIEGKLDSLDVTLDLSLLVAVAATADAISTAVGAVEGKLDASIDATVSSRASQASVDVIEAKLDAIEGKLDSGIVSVLSGEIDAIEGKLDVSLDTTVSSRASQSSVDTLASSADAISIAVGAIEAKLDAIEGKLDSSIATALDTIEGKLDASLDVAVSSRASQSSVDTLAATADAISSAVSAVEGKLDVSLDTTVSSRASQASLDTLTSTADAIKTAVDIVEAKLDNLDLSDLAGLPGTADAIKTSIDAVEAKLDNLDLSDLAGLPGTADAIKTAVDVIEAKLDNLDLSDLAGLPGTADAIKTAVDVIEAKTNVVLDREQIELQVNTIDHKRRYLVYSTESGVAVGVRIVSVRALRVQPGTPADVYTIPVLSSTSVDTGILDVTLDFPEVANHANFLEFVVRHGHEDPVLATVLHFGSILLPVDAEPPGPLPGDRVVDSLIVLYEFEEASGEVVHDTSGFGTPLNLEIRYPDRTSWGDGALSSDSRRNNIAQSDGPAEKVIDAMQATNEITIEAWVKPDDDDQEGPARIVTLSRNTSRRNFTLGQEEDSYDTRLRTTSTSRNGLPSLSTPEGTLTTDLTHVVYTREHPSGITRTYIDGVLVAVGSAVSTFNSWDDGYKLALANELTRNRAWLGEMHLVALYNRALDPDEVEQNFNAGP